MESKKSLFNIVPEPVTYDSIEFTNLEGEQIGYTDCWEISLYRFLHLAFGSPEGQPLKELMLPLMSPDPENKHAKLLLAHVSKYPKCHQAAYLYETEAGF